MSRDDVTDQQTDQQLKDFLAAKDFTAEQQEELQMIYGILSGSLQGFVNAISQMLDQREELELKTKKNNEALIDDLILDALNKTYIKAIQDTRTMIDEYNEEANDLLDKIFAKQAALREALQGDEEDLRACLKEQGMNPDDVDKSSYEELKEVAKQRHEDLGECAELVQKGLINVNAAGVALRQIQDNYDSSDPDNLQYSTENLAVLQNLVGQEDVNLEAIHDKVDNFEKKEEITLEAKNDAELTAQARMDEERADNTAAAAGWKADGFGLS